MGITLFVSQGQRSLSRQEHGDSAGGGQPSRRNADWGEGPVSPQERPVGPGHGQDCLPPQGHGS